MADNSFNTVVAQWIDANQWPRTNPQSILVVSAAANAGSAFQFRSAFSFFEVQAVYDSATSTLSGVQFFLSVPGKPDATILTTADVYPISASVGTPLTFDLGSGYLQGQVSFQYRQQNGSQNIFVNYNVILPFVGTLEDSLDIAPTQVAESTGFSLPQLRVILTLTPEELAQLARAIPSQEDIVAQQALLVKFLKDFVVDQDSIVIQSWNNRAAQWEGSISFLGILELVGSVDPATLTISAVLYAKIPIIGRVRLIGVEGSLITGVRVDIDIAIATGYAIFTVAKNTGGTYDLFVEASLTIKFIGTIATPGKLRILTLPF